MEDLSSTHEKDTSPVFPIWIGSGQCLSSIAWFWLGRRTDPEARRLYTGQSATRPLHRACSRRVRSSCWKRRGRIFPTCGGRPSLMSLNITPGKCGKGQNDPNGFTIVHGDINPGNILYPVDPGKVYFLDRQPFPWSLTTWLGVSDLSQFNGPVLGRGAAPSAGTVRPGTVSSAADRQRRNGLWLGSVARRL